MVKGEPQKVFSFWSGNLLGLHHHVRQPEVDQLYAHVLSENQVFGLQVAVHHFEAVAVPHGFQDLPQVLARLRLAEFAALLD